MGALRLGLTGGIGSGKSTVAMHLATHGAVVIDADAVSRSITEVGGEAIDAIRLAFGAEMITREGAMDRDAMRANVFSNPQAKQRLESIIHPLVGLSIQAKAQSAERDGARCIVFDIPLLVESRLWRKSLQRILVVDCQEATQVSRVVQRNGLTVEQILKIINAQTTRKQRLAAADAVLYNDGLDLSTLGAQVAEMASEFGL